MNVLGKFQDLQKCSRPVIFVNDDADFSYSLTGTGFFCLAEEHIFFVTVSHNLKDFSPNNLFILPDIQSRDCIPICRRFRFDECPDLSDEDAYRELLLFLVCEKELASQQRKAIANLDVLKIAEQGLEPIVGASIYVSGYPGEHNYVDYDKKKIIETRAEITGVISDKTGEETGTSVIDVANDVELSRYGGLSGSPAFVYKMEGGRVAAGFAGVVNRGGKAGKILRLLEARLVVGTIRQAVKKIAEEGLSAHEHDE